MVGATGFEPATSSSRTKRATKLRHAPAAEGPEYATSRLVPSRRSRSAYHAAPAGGRTGSRALQCDLRRGVRRRLRSRDRAAGVVPVAPARHARRARCCSRCWPRSRSSAGRRPASRSRSIPRPSRCCRAATRRARSTRRRCASSATTRSSWSRWRRTTSSARERLAQLRRVTDAHRAPARGAQRPEPHRRGRVPLGAAKPSGSRSGASSTRSPTDAERTRGAARARARRPALPPRAGLRRRPHRRGERLVPQDDRRRVHRAPASTERIRAILAPEERPGRALPRRRPPACEGRRLPRHAARPARAGARARCSRSRRCCWTRFGTRARRAAAARRGGARDRLDLRRDRLPRAPALDPHDHARRRR